MGSSFHSNVLPSTFHHRYSTQSLRTVISLSSLHLLTSHSPKGPLTELCILQGTRLGLRSASFHALYEQRSPYLPQTRSHRLLQPTLRSIWVYPEPLQPRCTPNKVIIKPSKSVFPHFVLNIDHSYDALNVLVCNSVFSWDPAHVPQDVHFHYLHLLLQGLLDFPMLRLVEQCWPHHCPVEVCPWTTA